MSRLVSLYPIDWRARYEEEFRILLAERPPSARDRIDIVRGAVDARLHPQSTAPGRIPDRSGYGALAGFAALLIAWFLAANGPVHLDEYGSYRDGGAALPFIVLAVALLSIGLYRMIARLPVGAHGAATAGVLAIVAGLGWSFMPWVFPLALIFILGVLGLAVGAWRTGILPVWWVVAFVALLAVPAGVLAALPFLPWYAFRVAGLDFAIVLAPLSGMWLLVAAVLLRGWARPATAST